MTTSCLLSFRRLSFSRVYIWIPIGHIQYSAISSIYFTWWMIIMTLHYEHYRRASLLPLYRWLGRYSLAKSIYSHECQYYHIRIIGFGDASLQASLLFTPVIDYDARLIQLWYTPPPSLPVAHSVSRIAPHATWHFARLINFAAADDDFAAADCRDITPHRCSYYRCRRATGGIDDNISIHHHSGSTMPPLRRLVGAQGPTDD